MDERIQIGDKLDLKKSEESLYKDSKPKIYVSQVLDEMENGNMLVSMPIQGGNVIPLAKGEKFTATFYTKAGLLACDVVVTGRYKKDSLFLLEMSCLSGLEKIQRREYFRLECKQEVQYRIIDEEERQYIEEGKAYSPDELNLEWKKGVILDISGGGLRFVSASKEEKETMIEARFEIELEGSMEVVYALGMLLRSAQSQNNHRIYEQRVQFYRMDDAMRERIIRYIFQTQRENHMKGKGLL